jgi:hypothetical protein
MPNLAAQELVLWREEHQATLAALAARRRQIALHELFEPL